MKYVQLLRHFRKMSSVIKISGYIEISSYIFRDKWIEDTGYTKVENAFQYCKEDQGACHHI